MKRNVYILDVNFKELTLDGGPAGNQFLGKIDTRFYLATEK